MSKRKFEFVRAAKPQFEQDIDWNLCLICQLDTNEKLRCPNDSKQSGKNSSYISLAEDLQNLSEAHLLPYGLTIDRLAGTDRSLEESFASNDAKFHKSCRNSCDKYHYQRAIKRRQPSERDDGKSARGTRSSYQSANFMESTCFFCDEVDTDKNLRTASTMALDQHIRSAATQLCDEKLLAKLSQGDVVAIKSKYHSKCLAKLYNRLRDHRSNESEGDKSKALVLGISLSEIVTYLRQCKEMSDRSPVFKLSDIKSRYAATMQRYGISSESVHSTRLKEQLLKYVPGLQAVRKGRDILLCFEEDSGDAFFDACIRDAEDDGMALARVAGIVRNEMFSNFPDFKGSFDAEYLKSSVPLSLAYLVRMLLEGTNVSTNDETFEETDNVAQEIAQLIRYNATKRTRDGGKRRHKLERETPLPIYVGLMLHAKTRKASITDRLAKLGLSIPSDRIENIKTMVTGALCERYKENDLVCPPCLQDGFFTTAAIDNIDHNATSTSAQQHFHDTGISLFQHPDEASQYKPTQYDLTSNDIGSYNAELPEYYTNISPVAKEKCNRPITLTNSTATSVSHHPIKESSE